MKEKMIDAWDLYNDGYYICILTNGNTKLQMISYTKSEPYAIMGAGIAAQAKTMFPELPKLLGYNLKNYGNHVYLYDDLRLFTFPTKNNYWEPSEIGLICQSCSELMNFMDNVGIEKVALPRPGCGFGGLKWKDVKQEIYMRLDDRVTIVREEK